MPSRRQQRSSLRAGSLPAGVGFYPPGAKAQSEYCASADIGNGKLESQRIEGLGYGTESGSDLVEACKRSRYFSKRNTFVKVILKARLSVYHHGFRLAGQDEKTSTALKAWREDEKNSRAWLDICNYARDAWREWFITQNVISLWRVDSERPTILHPEQIEYSDRFGIEVLKITHGLSHQEIDDLDLSPAIKRKLKESPVLKLTHEDEELFAFEVLKLEKVGCGLSWPDLTDVLLALGQYESHEVRDNVLAYAGRTVIEQHRLGHEIKSGMAAGRNDHFLKKPRADALARERKGKLGHWILASNFDHNIDFPGADPKHFEVKRYQAILERLKWWALPFGHMIEARAFNPLLMDVLRPLVLEDRRNMAMHLNRVINAVFEDTLPGRVMVKWDNKVLRDSRLLFDLVKNGLNAGPVSQTTYQRTGELDPEEERANKRAEAELPDEETQPLYDAAHGPPKGEKGGKPSGKKDKA